MGLNWLTRHAAAIIVWTSVALIAAGIVLASIGGAAGLTSLTDTGTGLIVGPIMFLIVGGAGYALASLRNREGRLHRLEENITDIQSRVERIESEQLRDTNEALLGIERALGVETHQPVDISKRRRNG